MEKVPVWVINKLAGAVLEKDLSGIIKRYNDDMVAASDPHSTDYRVYMMAMGKLECLIEDLKRVTLEERVAALEARK